MKSKEQQEQFRKELLEKLSAKYNLPVKTIDDIVKVPSIMLKKVIEKGFNESIRIPYLGLFQPSYVRLYIKGKITHYELEKIKGKELVGYDKKAHEEQFPEIYRRYHEIENL